MRACEKIPDRRAVAPFASAPHAPTRANPARHHRLAAVLPPLALSLALLSTATGAWADLTAAREQELRNFFVQDCGSCHGLTMRGGLGTPLLPENLKDKPDFYLRTVILEGIPGKPMPPWKALLNEIEVDFLIQLMRQGPDQ